MMKLNYSKAKVPPKLFLSVLVLNVFGLITQLEIWLLGFICLCICWHIAIFTKQLEAPNNTVKFITTVASCAILAISTVQLGFLISMVHLLVMAYALKPIEINGDRDVYQLLIIGLLVLLCGFIFNQSIYFSMWTVAAFIVNLLLIAKSFNMQLPAKQNIKPIFSIVLQALPITLLLFFVFPKLSPFWQMPYAKNAETGLSDTVKVGDIANLALSNELAFRVEFDGEALPHHELYWRSIVLQDFDGVQWENKVLSPVVRKPLMNANEGKVYRVFAEPSHQKWVFTLANSYPSEQAVTIKPLLDGTFMSTKKIRKTIAYQLVYKPEQYATANITAFNRLRNKRVPPNSNPKLYAKGLALAEQYKNPRDIVQSVLTELNTEPFQYTLNPPRLNQNSLDQFFFETKSGFCEHYASSFAYILRAAGVPTRMVLGYMGGEYNAQAKYYNVYQRNAHAWNEVYIEGEGWMRVDPTGAVHPDRVNQGFSQTLLDEQADLNEVPELFNNMWHSNFISAMRASFDVIDYNWTKWVVSYSKEKQVSLMANLLNLKNYWKTIAGIFLSAVFLVILAYCYHYFSRRKKVVLTKENIVLNKLVKRFDALGITWLPADTVQEYVHRVGQQYPVLAAPLSVFLGQYNAIVYKDLKEEDRVGIESKLEATANQLQSLIKTLLAKRT